MEKRCWDLPEGTVSREMFNRPTFKPGVRLEKWLAGWNDSCPFLANQEFGLIKLEDETKEAFIPAMYFELEAFVDPQLFFWNICHLVRSSEGVLLDSYPGNLAFVWIERQFCAVSIAYVGPWEIEIHEMDDNRLWPAGTRLLSQG